MEILQIGGSKLDVQKCDKFTEHYNNPNGFTKYIIDNEINSGQWHDEVLDLLPNDSVIIDAGANVGLFTIYMLPKIGTAHLIEPTRSHVEVLNDTFKYLPFHIHELALTNFNGTCELKENADNSTMNEIGVIVNPVFSNKQNKVIVNCSTLYTFMDRCKLNKVDLLKLDIEGAEQQVIMEDESSAAALKRCGVVYVEVHPPPYGNADEKGIVEKMKSLGFSHKPGKRGLSHYFINEKAV